MALAYMGDFSQAIKDPAFLARVDAVNSAIAPALQRYRAANGSGPVGVSITLDNGIMGHFGPDGQFYIDLVPPIIQAQAAYTGAVVQQTGAPPPAAPAGAPPNPFIAQPAAMTQAPAAAAPTAPKTIFGLPPLVVAGAGGVLIFLIARRL